MGISIQPLSDAELETADNIARSAFGTSESRLADIRLYLSLQPDGWFLARYRDHPAGIVGVTDYGAFAYIGLMAVRSRLQRKGLGHALLEHILQWTEERRISLVLLDGTAAGRPLYSQFGFIEFDQSLLFQHNGQPKFTQFPREVRPLRSEDLQALVELDTPIFGANREAVFRALMNTFTGRAFGVFDDAGRVAAYLFVQARRLGPWVALQPEHAEALLRAALSLPFDGPPVTITPNMNGVAAELLENFGFRRVLANHHMLRGGASLPSRRTHIYAQTSFAVG